jgi:F-type H+-transporting ATPase subunit b
MELVTKIFETLEITQLVLVQLGIVIVLALALAVLLVRPLLDTFDERDNLTVKPMEESRRLIAEAQEKSRYYEEELHKGYKEAVAKKRVAAEEASRAGKKRIEATTHESNKKLEEIKSGILAEKEAAAAALRAEIAQLSRQIAEKVLGRQVA